MLAGDLAGAIAGDSAVGVFAHAAACWLLGAVLMQFCVQGAWGVVPAHVAELSPDSVRGTLPGLGNQIGVALSSVVAVVEAVFATGRSYAVSMSMTAAFVFCLAALLVFVGRENRAVDLTSSNN